MSTLQNTITLAYDLTNPNLLTHLCEDGSTLCGKSTADMKSFDTTIRGKRAVADFVDCAACTRALQGR